jgi:hypothetical protein
MRTGALFEFTDDGKIIDENGNPVINAGAGPITREISIKIDFRRFLPFAGIKYLPAFAGNIQLKVQFSPDALVYCPISPQSVLGSKFDISKCPVVTNRFMPLGENLTVLSTYAADGAIDSKDDFKMTLNRSKFGVELCDSHLWCFGLDEDIYNALVQRYTNAALTFPIQTTVWADMNGGIGTKKPSGGQGDLNLTTTPRFVEAIFLLFRKHHNWRTVYENPKFATFILKMGGFQTVPQTPIRSDGPILVELVQNALNLNNDITGINIDVMKSLTAKDDPNDISKDGKYGKYTRGLESYDVTNFILALPTSLDYTFQQGQTSNSPVTYNFKYSYGNSTPFLIAGDAVDESQAMLGFLKDSVFTIQINPRGGPPLVTLDDYDITSPQESA